VKPLERVLEKLEVAAGPDSGSEYFAFCPAHDDRNSPDLRLREAEDGRVLLRCFAGCGQDDVLSALAQNGVGKNYLFSGGADRKRGEEDTTPRDRAHACTLEAYAEAKGLPVELLGEWHEVKETKCLPSFVESARARHRFGALRR
jgi:hypothetical protein